MEHDCSPQPFTLVMQRVFHVSLLSSVSPNGHFLKQSSGMIPAEPGHREHQEGWAKH